MKQSAMLILFLPIFAFAKTYTCNIEKTADDKTSNVVWSGDLNLKNGKETQAASVIIKVDKTAVSIENLLKTSAKTSAQQLAELFKPYEGLLTVSLWKDEGKIKIIQGVVKSDEMAKTGPSKISYEAFGWANDSARELGVMNREKNLSIHCKVN